MTLGLSFLVKDYARISVAETAWMLTGYNLTHVYIFANTNLLCLYFGITISMVAAVCKNLEHHLKTITISKPGEDPLSHCKLIQKGLKLFGSLKQVEKLFARVLFINILVGLCSIILTFFVSVTLFFNLEPVIDCKAILLGIGVVGLAAMGVGFGSFCPEMTHILLKSTESLIDKLDTIPTKSDADIKVILDDGSKCRFIDAKQFVLRKLRSFKGFSILSFFTVRRSILTSIMAHFITYLIVLLQFKVSEFDTSGSCNCSNKTLS